MNGRWGSVLKAALGIVFLALFIDRFFPSIPLSLLSHERAPRPIPLAEPVQESAGTREPWAERRRGYSFTIRPRTTYDVSARVASTERYRAGAAGALVPWDFVLTWGDVTREPYLSKVTYVQIGRFYNWSTNDGSLDPGIIASQSANTHLIPADSRVAFALGRVRTGDVVRLVGDLVDVAGPDGFEWKTSLSRTDTGAGGCELLYVRAVTVGARLYRRDG
jgi:hypothetical protein